MVRIVSVSEAKTRMSGLLRAVEAGEDMVIARRGAPVARLIPVQRHQPGEWGDIALAEADHEALLAPMSEEEIVAFERIDPKLGI
ncbi:MAG: type II toxin-antitoxin system prevent-host-death family antitoxin [Oceanicaulis sp.]|nr:type II toxin-antitoxin system prevent-host-death family antitoxin [Oceanicaulis sp.]